MSQRTICFLIYPGCQSLDVCGPYEVFAGANTYLRARGRPDAYKLVLAGWRKRTLRTESGLGLVADIDVRGILGNPDTLFVPGSLDTRQPERNPELVRALRRLAKKSRRIAGVCSGAFFLAAAGLLDGRRATTHWAACGELARRYPKISVDPDPIYVCDRNIYTSAGVTAGIDLSLALVETDLGRDVALTIARWLVLFLRRPANQKQFSAQLRGQLAERDALRRLQGFIADHLNEDLSVERLAKLAGMSPRNFARCFRAEVGMTPARYVAQVRLEAARRMLEDSMERIEAIAANCGFGTPETLRRTFLRELKTIPREYRNRFQSTTASVHPTSTHSRRTH
jgi:transcriptional regulator GlxA family with amidase domain